MRLTATLAANELVVLTNQRSGADVICRVVSVKAQPGIQNYVDLEFTQRASGFWGDCFPSEPLPATSVTHFALPEASGSFAPSLNKPTAPQLAPSCPHSPSRQPYRLSRYTGDSSASPSRCTVDAAGPGACWRPRRQRSRLLSHRLPCAAPGNTGSAGNCPGALPSLPGMGQMGMELMHPVESQQAAWPSEAQARTWREPHPVRRKQF